MSIIYSGAKRRFGNGYTPEFGGSRTTTTTTRRMPWGGRPRPRQLNFSRNGRAAGNYSYRNVGGAMRRISAGRRRALLNARTGGFMGIEKKFLDCSLSDSAVSAPSDATAGEHGPTTGCTGCITAPAQGDSEQNRDGRKISVDSIYLTGLCAYALQQDQSDVLPAPTVFIALVMDTQTNAATIVSENVFTNPSTSADTNGYPLRNLSNSTRFRVLDSVTITPVMMTAMQDGTNSSAQVVIPIPFKLSSNIKFQVSFNTGTTANVSTVVDNSIHVISYAIGTSFAPKISYLSRMRFYG